MNVIAICRAVIEISSRKIIEYDPYWNPIVWIEYCFPILSYFFSFHGSMFWMAAVAASIMIDILWCKRRFRLVLCVRYRQARAQNRRYCATFLSRPVPKNTIVSGLYDCVQNGQLLCGQTFECKGICTSAIIDFHNGFVLEVKRKSVFGSKAYYDSQGWWCDCGISFLYCMLPGIE